MVSQTTLEEGHLAECRRKEVPQDCLEESKNCLAEEIIGTEEVRNLELRVPSKGTLRVSYKGVSSQHQKVGARLQEYWEVWMDYQVDPWVVQVLREGYRIPFLSNKLPPLTSTPLEYVSYQGNVEKFAALEREVGDMLEKGAIEEVQAKEPAFYNRLFLVPKPSGKWRPVLDVSRLNKFVQKTRFSMETPQTVQEAIREGDWMISLDMSDAYFHVPIHPQSRRYLRFVFNKKIYQFKVLCFGLSTAPQVFTRVMAPLGKIVHLAGFRMVLYLDDWLVIASSRNEMLRAREFVLKLAEELGSHNKLRKVSFGPISAFNIPRHGDRLHSFLGFSH